MIRAGVVSAADVLVSDPVSGQINRFLGQVHGVTICRSNEKVVQSTDTVIIATKPDNVRGALQPLREVFNGKQLLLSVAAGVTIRQLTEWSGTGRVIRAMPNTPCLIGHGASAFSRGRDATEEDATWVHDLLTSVGFVVELPESLLDAVTGLSGSGPAFVYLMIEAMIDGGVLQGLPRDVGLKLAAHTVRGAAEMVLSTGLHPAELRDRVTSPAGTTIAGLAALWQQAMPAAIVSAVSAATLRSIALQHKED
jgi:pyrroline-5-carboxylate reductase